MAEIEQANTSDFAHISEVLGHTESTLRCLEETERLLDLVLEFPENAFDDHQQAVDALARFNSAFDRKKQIADEARRLHWGPGDNTEAIAALERQARSTLSEAFAKGVRDLGNISTEVQAKVTDLQWNVNEIGDSLADAAASYWEILERIGADVVDRNQFVAKPLQLIQSASIATVIAEPFLEESTIKFWGLLLDKISMKPTTMTQLSLTLAASDEWNNPQTQRWHIRYGEAKQNVQHARQQISDMRAAYGEALEAHEVRAEVGQEPAGSLTSANQQWPMLTVFRARGVQPAPGSVETLRRAQHSLSEIFRRHGTQGGKPSAS